MAEAWLTPSVRLLHSAGAWPVGMRVEIDCSSMVRDEPHLFHGLRGVVSDAPERGRVMVLLDQPPAGSTRPLPVHPKHLRVEGTS